MERIHENMKYNDIAICNTCGKKVQYHVTDIKGVDPKYIQCPHCDSMITLIQKI